MAEPTVPLRSAATITTGAVPFPPQSFGCHPELMQPLTLAALAGVTVATMPENSSAKIARNEMNGLKVLALCIMTPSVSSAYLTSAVFFDKANVRVTRRF